MYVANKMNLSVIVGVLLFLGTVMASAPAQAQSVSQGQMQQYCQGEASAKLNINPRDISTEPVEKTKSGRYIVWGQTPPYGSNATTFACGFDERGRFQNVEVKSWANNTGGGASSGSITEGQMQKYCQGEASAKLNVNPRDISTNPAEETKSGRYIVWGQTPPYGSNATTFACGFDERGRFQNVEVKSRPNNTGGNTSSDSIPEAQMSKYCQGEASAMLGTRPAYISTQRAVRQNNGFVVYGQSPPEGGYNTTTFECNFNWNGVFSRVVVTGRPGSGSNSSNNAGSGNAQLPRSAARRCHAEFGAPADITQVSPLRPGFWEVILQAQSGPRMAACTVAGSGDIENWVEMN